MLDDAASRSYVVAKHAKSCRAPHLVARISKVPGQLPRRTISPIQNKIGEFLVNPILRRVIGQPKSSFDLRQVMDEGKILLVNFAKRKLGKILQRFWEPCS